MAIIEEGYHNAEEMKIHACTRGEHFRPERAGSRKRDAYEEERAAVARRWRVEVFRDALFRLITPFCAALSISEIAFGSVSVILAVSPEAMASWAFLT